MLRVLKRALQGILLVLDSAPAFRLEPVESVAPVATAVLAALVVPKCYGVRVFGQDHILTDYMTTADRKT